jgi:alkanesulfonate monooxygenase
MTEATSRPRAGFPEPAASAGSPDVPAAADAPDAAGGPAPAPVTGVEFVGMIGTRDGSETRPPAGPVVDADYTRRFARAHEDAGFDRILIGYSSGSPDGTQVAAHVAAHTERLGLLVAHRPGFVAPTLAARTFATLDQFAGGRVAVHIITGGHDAEQRRDGDYLPKDERYARTDEYLTVLKRAWTADEPFGFAGDHYRFEDFHADVRPAQQPRIPLYFGGSSPAAYRVGGKHADVFALWGEPLAETAEQIASVRAAARAAGRTVPPRISVSFRPILGATEEAAWDRAHRILDTINRRGAAGSLLGTRRAVLPVGPGAEPQNTGSQRLLAAAGKADRHDRALWTAPAAATGAPGNSTALVGTPETVARALLDYVDIGVTTLLIRGYDPLDDVVDYGRELLPLVRAEVARRAAAQRPRDTVAAGGAR